MKTPILHDQIWQFIGVVVTTILGILGLLVAIFALPNPAQSICSAICIVVIALSTGGIFIVIAHARGRIVSWKIIGPNILLVLIAVFVAIVIVVHLVPSIPDIHANLIYDDSMRGPHPDDGTWDQTKESELKTVGAGDCTFGMDGYHVSAVYHYRECKAKIANLTGNFKMEARVTILVQGSVGGFLLRRQDGAETGYLVDVGATGPCQILRDPGGISLTSLCHTTAENSYLLDVTMLGPQITVEVDNSVVAHASDTTYVNGIIGLYISGSDSSPLKTEVVFTDVKVWNM